MKKGMHMMPNGKMMADKDMPMKKKEMKKAMSGKKRVMSEIKKEFKKRDKRGY